MLKRILSDIDVKEFTGLMLLFAGLVVYVIFDPGTVDPDQSNLIQITLADNPEYDEDTETGYDYFTLRARGIGRKFIVKYWVLNQRTIEAINEIKIENDLIITIEKSEMNGVYIKEGESEIHALALKRPNDNWIYSLSDYNNGKASRWKEFLFFGLFFGVLLLPFLIGKLRRIIKKEPEIVTELRSIETD